MNLSYETEFFLMQISLVAVVLVLHTYIGLHVIRRTLIFSDLVLDQLAALGAMISVGLGFQYGGIRSYLISLAAVLAGALLLAIAKPGSRLIPREAVIGIMYAMALVACLLLGDKMAGGGAYVTKTMAGSMLWVSWPLVEVTAGVYVVLLVFHLVFRRRFIALAAGNAADAGLNEKFWDFMLFTTQGIITVLIVPIAGVLLAYAFLMIPAAIAAMFSRTWGRAVLLGWGIGLAACIAGICGSYYLDLPYGPSLVLCMGAVFVIAIIARGLTNGPAAGD